MKNLRKWLALTGVGLLLVLSVAAVSAAPPNANSVPNDIPATAAYINGQTQSLAGNTSLWYKFDYNGLKDSDYGRTPVTVTLPYGALNGLGFEVYAPAQIADWWEQTPVGRGTAQQLYDDGVPTTHGPNTSPDLTWVGRFPESGTYYVRVVNNNPGAETFALDIQGLAAYVGQ